MGTTTLVIDGNNVGYSANHATKLSVGGVETQAVYGSLKTISQLRRRFAGSNCLVLWDGRAQWRYDLFPEYKSNRESTGKKKEDRESYKQQRPVIVEALRYLGVKQVTDFNSEADDLAAYFSKALTTSPDNRVILVTGDEDWLQLVTSQVDWFDFKKEEHVRINRFSKYTGYVTPDAFVQGKALQGDSSDTIKGVGGIGEKGAAELMAKYGSVRGFLSTPWTDIEKEGKKLRDFWGSEPAKQILARNLTLMDLNAATSRISFANKEVISVPPDFEAFRDLCERLAFRSILNHFDEFITSF